MEKEENEHQAGEVGPQKQFTSVRVIEKDSLKKRQMEWRAGELNMRQRGTAYEGQSCGRDGRGEMERGQRSERMPDECQERG